MHSQQACLALLPPVQQLLLLPCSAAAIAYKTACSCLSCCVLLQRRALQQQLNKRWQQVALHRNACKAAPLQHTLNTRHTLHLQFKPLVQPPVLEHCYMYCWCPCSAGS
jgi:hypothetical protein